MAVVVNVTPIVVVVHVTISFGCLPNQLALFKSYGVMLFCFLASFFESTVSVI